MSAQQLGLDYSFDEPCPVLAPIAGLRPAETVSPCDLVIKNGMGYSREKARLVFLSDSKFVFESGSRLESDSVDECWDHWVRHEILVGFAWSRIQEVLGRGFLYSFETRRDLSPFYSVADAIGVDGVMVIGERPSQRVYPYAYRLHKPNRTKVRFLDNEVTFRYRDKDGGAREFIYLKQVWQGQAPLGTLFPSYYIQLYVRRCADGYCVSHGVLFETARVLSWLYETVGAGERDEYIAVNRQDGTKYIRIPMRRLVDANRLVCHWTDDEEFMRG